MKRSKQELMEQLKKVLADNDSDDALALVEDLNDSFDEKKSDDADWEKKYADAEKEWKKKLDDNDSQWRKKYKDRFFQGESTEKGKEKEEDVDKEVLEKEHAEKVSIDDLFTSKGD